MNYKIGEKVTFMSEAGYAVIQSFKDANTVIIQDETGFNRDYPISELVKIQSENYAGGGYADKDNIEYEAEIKHTIKEQRLDFDTTDKQQVWEIDLHMHEIVEDDSAYDGGAKLRKQVREFKAFYKNARKNHIRKIIAIHGVGEGILKNEIRTYLDTQEFLEYYDADYREYGKGATAVELQYK
ncbi:DNA-nicking endonuclease, Smr domain [Lishizhenia tianjinensis]|uniref:DNA-nicking endonuclease, Smr domain n=1 Tax=Lishizhenia tianjinensis TaxID=477690 RepID=A0A1I7BUK3_9FLAO|nr:Smr/MutS family protein [Lishizhenia tianjinensis]SFT90843.1 DNA-nicking endonuclease, Smr domain [Lishizhenia tianjinensis]